MQGLWPWAFFSQIFTPKFWKSLRTDGLIQTYQRGHKIVANVHSVGGNTANTRYVGIDQYGNKYYEDFDPLCKDPDSQIATSADGSNTMITYQSGVPMEIWCLPSGTDGWPTNTTKSQPQKVKLSTTPSSKNPTSGTIPTAHSSNTPPGCPTSTSEPWTTLITEITATLRSGNPLRRDSDVTTKQSVNGLLIKNWIDIIYRGDGL